MRVVMLELFAPTTRQSRAVAQAEVRTIVENSYVGFPEQTGDGAEGAPEAAVKEHGIFASKKIGNASLELAMEIGHPRENRCAARAQTMCKESLLGGCDDLGVIREAEVIIGT